MLVTRSQFANLKDFRSPTPKVLYGDLLLGVKNIQKSILEHGLLNPLVVSKNQGQLTVIDGRKRLVALRRLKFKGQLPRSLVKVPYVLVDRDHKPSSDPELLTNAEIYQKVKDMRNRGFSIADTAKSLFKTKHYIHDILLVDNLSKRLKIAFLGDALSLAQVKAFATLDNKDAQDALLTQLGPFAENTDILQAISKGVSVLNLSDDNVIILPSRSRRDFVTAHAA